MERTTRTKKLGPVHVSSVDCHSNISPLSGRVFPNNFNNWFHLVEVDYSMPNSHSKQATRSELNEMKPVIKIILKNSPRQR